MDWGRRLIACCFLACSTAVSSEALGQLGQPSKTHELGRAFQIQVAPGSDEEAITYYRDVVTAETGFPTSPRPHVDELLTYFGYGITGLQPEEQDSAVTMAQFPGGDVLVSRFFAPKITDVSGAAAPSYGWRKLVRIRAKAGSPAAAKGLKSLFLLFNVFNADLNISPFTLRDGSVNHSVNNQVMLVRQEGSPLKPIYFLTFGAFNSSNVAEQGRLITFLDASFDAGAPNLPSIQRYYVPTACAQCHGGRVKSKLNYLDTDHWFDRVSNDDFDAVGAKQPLVFDAGTNDPSSSAFKTAFNVLRIINTEIREQNRDADGTTPSFQQLAVESWLRNHATTESHVSLFNRSLTGSGVVWNAANPVDAQLLPMLNRYCFRCHSSLRFHIYDKGAILDRVGSMVDRVNKNPDGLPQYFMPQDRALSPETKQKIIELLNSVRE